MIQLMMAFLLFCGSEGSFAQTVNEPSEPTAHQPVLLALSEDILGQSGVEFFNDTAKSSSLYAFLLRLNEGVPQIAKTLEYVSLLNEVHCVNQTLTQLLLETQKNNQLLSHLLLTKGGRDG